MINVRSLTTILNFQYIATGYGSDYEDESSRYPAPNGMIPGTHNFGPESDRLHRNSPPNSYNQQIVPGNHSNRVEQPSFDEWDFV